MNPMLAGAGGLAVGAIGGALLANALGECFPNIPLPATNDFMLT